MQLLCVLGRQPALGLAELESRFGADAIKPADGNTAVLTIDEMPDFDQLGSILKVAEIIDTISSNDWDTISRQLPKPLKKILETLPDSKVTLGLSAYGIRTNPRKVSATALFLKKTIKASGRPARIVPNNEVELGTAQVIHNKLTLENGIELVLIPQGRNTIIARTLWIQDIEAYARRDQGRPARDARVGMLPPKLAQVIISLSLAPKTSLTNNDNLGATILDPFCGTGVLLQETLLQKMRAYGSDLEPRMIEYSAKNLEWLNASADTYRLEQGDATSYQWQKPFDTIACETYLGRPFAHEPDPETLTKVVHDTNIIHKKFLQNVATQTKTGFRMCIAVPAWHVKGHIKHLPVLDHLEELGYNRVKFVHASQDDLIYHRAGQVVGRELVILVRK